MIQFISHMSLVIALAAYSVSSGLFLHAFPHAEARLKVHKAALYVFWAATLMILVALGASLSGDYYNQTGGLVFIASVSIITLYLSYRHRIRLMGIFVSPLASLVLVYLAFSYPKGDHIQASSPHLMAKAHILVSTLGQAFAIAAFGISCLYLLQQRALKKKLFNFISRATPPLDRLEKSMMACLWIGFICLTLGLLSGAVYTGFFVKGSIDGLLVKVLWAILVWIWYLAILIGKNVLGLGFRRVSKMSIAGFLLLAITFFGLYRIGGLH